jgi:aryl carrier-like protein
VHPGDAAISISIGGPIANTQCWVLDAHGAPMPIGIPGELYIGGAGVAHGYWERPALTSERFTVDTLTNAPGARLYRTGDLARWRADGSLECLGRTDHQIKLRGFRIELGEIEACITSYPGVRQAVAIVREDRPGEKRLVAYLVLGAESGDLVEALRAQARKTLPEYMVPSFWVTMDRLPLTPNGKIDRKALPAPAAPAAGHGAPPKTPTESLVLDLFRDVMGRQDLGVNDSFFEYGGDSLMAAQLMRRLRSATELDLALRHLFDRPTAAGLAGVVDRLAWVAHTAQPVVATGSREEMVL